MEKLEFKNYCVQEMNSDEMREKSGGGLPFLMAIVGGVEVFKKREPMTKMESRKVLLEYLRKHENTHIV